MEQLGAMTFAFVFVMSRFWIQDGCCKQANPSQSLELGHEFNDLEDLYNNFKMQGLFHSLKPLKCHTNICMFKRDMGLSMESFNASPMLNTDLYNFSMDPCCLGPCSRTYDTSFPTFLKQWRTVGNNGVTASPSPHCPLFID